MREGRVRSRDLETGAVNERTIADAAVTLDKLHPDVLEAIKRLCIPNEAGAVTDWHINSTTTQYRAAPFTVAGPLEARLYPPRLANTLGRRLSVVQVLADVDTAPSSDCVITVHMGLYPEVDPPAELEGLDYEGPIATVTIPAGQTVGNVDLDPQPAWKRRGYLQVEVESTGGAADLTLQVVAR